MAVVALPTWKSGVWTDTIWADGVWSSTIVSPPPPPPPIPVPVPVPIPSVILRVEIKATFMAVLEPNSPAIRKGDVGTILRWTVFEDGQVDISSATLKQVKIVRPDSTHILQSLSFSSDPFSSGDGIDGRVEYKILLGDINQKGTYRWQLYFEFLQWTGHINTGSFVVEDTLF
jgi:hypothetical protein